MEPTSSAMSLHLAHLPSPAHLANHPTPADHSSGSLPAETLDGPFFLGSHALFFHQATSSWGRGLVSLSGCGVSSTGLAGAVFTVDQHRRKE